MNSSLFAAIQSVLAAQSGQDLERALPVARAAAADEHADAEAVVAAVAEAVREKIRLSAEIAGLSRVDQQTGLANRRAFDERLQLELRRSARSRKSFALVFVVLDSGEPGTVAQALRAQVREVDFAARVSEQQFALLLIDVDRSSAQVISGRIDGTLRHANVQAAIGMALSYPVDTGQTLIERADAAVYDARFGR